MSIARLSAAAVAVVLLTAPATGQEPQPWRRAQLVPDIELADGRRGIRCGTRPSTPAEVELARLATGRGDDRKLTVPVVFHVVTAGHRYDVTDKQVSDSMAVLNRAYRARGFAFTLRQVVRHDDKAFARKCVRPKAERVFKQRHAVDPATTLNVYTCAPRGGLLGYAWLPQSWPEDHFLHGAVIAYDSVPGGAAVPYDEGNTLVHEVGHYLGLLHTFQGGCRGDGDYVDDTPAERRAAYGCPLTRDSCRNDPGLDPVENFMNYSDDACMFEFTRGQKVRMADLVATYKPTLWAQS